LPQLWIQGNQLSIIPDEIGQLENLQSLYLSSNQLTLISLEIGKLDKLKDIYLANNNFSDEEKQKIKTLFIKQCYVHF